MEKFVVSARKYRPVTFETVVSQRHITQTLKNAVKTGHLAQAFLFSGPRGVGKTTCARILAKTINCQNLQDNIEPCGQCDSCIAFQNNQSFNIYELDAASNNSVEDVRALVEQVKYPPQGAKYKVYIIDEVHMLSTSAFNAFLKTLEEPPPYAIFILATTEKHKILPTILSRCQVFEFNRLKVAEIVSHLKEIADKEGIKYEKEALHVIGEKADGAMRDALSIFDQIVSASGNNLSYKATIENLNILDSAYYFSVADALFNGDTSEVLIKVNEVIENGFDVLIFTEGLARHFRDLLLCKDPQTIKLLEAPDSLVSKYAEQGNAFSLSFIFNSLNLLHQAEASMRQSRHVRLDAELFLLKICHLKNVFQFNGLPAQEEKKKN